MNKPGIGPMTIAWISLLAAVIACQLGGEVAQQSPAETSAAESQPLTKSTPTPGGVPIEPTLEPTAPSAPTQEPPLAPTAPSGGGSAATAQVVATTSYTSADGVFHVIGAIENDGAFPIWQIQVKFDIFDEQGVVMDTVTGYPGFQLLLPGEVIPFEAEFASPFPRQVGDVEVSMEGEPLTDEEIAQNSYLNSLTHACEVVQVEGRPPDSGDFEVVGEVRNTSDQSVKDFGVSLMVYDAADNLLGVFTHIVPDKYVIGQGILLAPGETTTFEGWFGTLAEGGEPARIVVGCEGTKTQ